MISIIVCSITPQKFKLVSDNFNAVLGDAPYELIGIHDARSLSEGYNRGIARSCGDIVIFCHDDIEILGPAFYRRLCEHLETYDVIGCAGTSCLIESAWAAAGDPFTHGVVAYPAVKGTWPSERYDLLIWGGIDLLQAPEIQALDGFFIAVKRAVLERVQFDEVNFDGFHVYDTDFTFAAHLAGFRLAVCKDLLIAHQSGGNYSGEYETYSARFAEKYRGHLTPLPRANSKAGIARNLDRAQAIRLLKLA
jgi:GT2 family glycosyltransferase